MKRRVEQPDRHRQARHRLEDPLEVRLLEREQPVERRAPPVLGVGHDHLLDDGEPLVAEEHVLGARQADALGAELTSARRVLGRVRVRPHVQAPRVVGPAENGLEVLVDLRRNERHLADENAAGAAVDRDDVALSQRVVADPRRARSLVDLQPLAARDARLAHAARDDGGVRRHAAVHGEDPLRGDHPVDVVGGRLPPDEDDRAVVGALDRRVGVEHDPADLRRRERRSAPSPPPHRPPSDRSSGAEAGRAVPGRCGRSRPRA